MERKDLVYNIHKKAMDHCYSAALAKTKDRCDGSMESALYMEISAAFLCQENLSKSILFRSAASIALELNENALAQNLAEEGLKYSTADEITRELQDILDQIK